MKRRCRVCHTEYEGPERFCSLDGGPIVVDEASVDDPLIGRTIDGRYFVRTLRGRGGMGVVYEAEHIGLDRQVAIKFVSHAEADGDTRARFRQEARAASKVAHPHVVQVMDVGADADADYIVMELVQGRDLQAVLAGGAMDVDRVIAITRQVLDGLQAIHDAGIIHRDIKPANVLLLDGPTDVVKITDFGIAKSVRDGGAQLDTGTGRVIGTPQFMAPEHLMGRAIDHRADLYSVGTMMFLMITGSLPFHGTSITKLADFADVPAPNLAGARSGLSPGLVAAVATALEKDPRDRFADARAFRAALSDLAPSPAVEGRSSSPAALATTRPSVPTPRNRASPELASTVVSRAGEPPAPSSRNRPSWRVAGILSVVAIVVTLVGIVRVASSPAEPAEPRSSAPSQVALAPDASLDARAPDPPEDRLASLIADAEAAVISGQTAKAIAAYQDAIAAGGEIALEAKVAELYDGLGAHRDARDHYERYVTLGPPGELRDRVAARLAVLAPRPSVTVKPNPFHLGAKKAVVPAVPGPGERRCECLAYEAESQVLVCQVRRKDPECWCRLDSGQYLCSVVDEVKPDGSRQCATRWMYPASPGATCDGFKETVPSVGTINCTYCGARDGGQFGNIFFGNQGDTCRGYSLPTGKPLTGQMVRCKTEDEWNRR